MNNFFSSNDSSFLLLASRCLSQLLQDLAKMDFSSEQFRRYLNQTNLLHKSCGQAIMECVTAWWESPIDVNTYT